MVLRKGHRMYLAPVAVNETWLGGGVVEAMLRGPEGSRALRKGEAGCSTSSAVRDMSSALWSAVSMALSADGGLVASASWDGRVGLWDAASGQRLAILQGHTGMVSTVALSADEHLVASGSVDGKARLWETGTGQPAGTLQGHTGVVYGVRLSGDGRLVASCGADGTVRMWDTGRGDLLATLDGHAGAVSCVAVNGIAGW